MTCRTRFLGVVLGALSGALMAQPAASAQSSMSTTGTQIVSGSVVQYSGSSIVLKTADGRTTTYMLGPNVQLPPGVAIGRDVTLSTRSGTSGSQSVVTGVDVKTTNPADSGPSSPPSSTGGPRQPVTYTSTQTSSPMAAPAPSSAASGQSSSGSSGQYTSGQSSTQPGSAGASTGSGQSSDIPPTSGLSSGTGSQSDTSASATSFTGKVTAYQPKQSITIEQPGKGTVTYTIDAHSDLPQDVAVGRTVTITTTTAQGSSKPVVKTVTTTTRTMKMTTESHPQ